MSNSFSDPEEEYENIEPEVSYVKTIGGSGKAMKVVLIHHDKNIMKTMYFDLGELFRMEGFDRRTIHIGCGNDA